MQDILQGTVPPERFQFQIKQNYQYLMDYTRCWAVGFSKCTCYEEMDDWYQIVKNTMEGTVKLNRDYWAEQGSLAECMISLFPCNILYRFFGEDLLPKCKLPKESIYYKWFEFYLSDSYLKKTENEIRIVNKLCENKTEREQARLLELFAISCNYEVLQWQDMYYNMTTWPMNDIFPKKFTTIKE